MTKGKWTDEELWELFGHYEEKAHLGIGADYRLAAATMANAIARIIVSREETSTYNMFRKRNNASS